MPTPFNHVVLAQQMLEDGQLPAPVRARLRNARSAFLLGNTAPDYGALIDVPRHETHFFRVPLGDATPAHERLLRVHPQLGRPDHMDDDQAAFVAGYLAHLWLDQAWISELFEPYFGPRVARGSFRERLIEHNLLRAYLDLEDRERIPDDLGAALRAAQPEGWLPFASDAHLARWRDDLAAQVEPGGEIRTVAVFAERLNMAPQEFARRLGSPADMQRTVFSNLPRRRLKSFMRRGFLCSRELVQYYLQGDLEHAPRVGRPVHKQAPHPTQPSIEGRR